MILIILFIGILLFIGGFLLLPTRLTRILGGGLGLLILLGAAGLMLGNDNYHWGMRRATTEHTSAITSIAPNKQLNVLVYQPLKESKNERVYVYRSTATNRQQTTTADLKTTNRVVIGQTTTAQLTTKTTSWQYRSGFWRTLFAHTGKHHEAIRQQNTFDLPQNWVTLSTRQAKWLEAAAKEQEKAAKKAEQQAVTKIVKQQLAAMTNPTAAQRQQVTAKAQKAVTQELQKQAPTRVAQLVKQAKQQPVE
ncbi:DUF4811 domain-containing protein [Levilactobacillus acidifarinae]|uniref:DUF4811 domain-containing protein n=1 Tax=Levilactobacillus acidifarinae DSM 19394 = JCM 15949 TaxID=1423715 RepID=A0A0R1LH53_9LACO|nr:DUF4811 domain-containing protein [Levilactobacillus acidifarinae]KRK95055.1 hypothetical protein FD25_GL002242 [Levilactobacillus acidifarinae DSM 19394]GEO70782.1 DUF4811 domain-containing protein [Levilactobacillus acidifarinae]